MTFELTILGSSSALPRSNRFPSAHVLNAHERLFLIDCAEGTQMQLRRFKLKFSRIEAIFISHPHGDHVLGLVGLISTLNLLGRKNPLLIFAHSSFEPLLHQNINFFVKNLNFRIVFKPINPDTSYLLYEDKRVTVQTIPLRHRIPSTGFLFREKEQPLNIRKEQIFRHCIPLARIGAIKYGEDFLTDDGILIPNKDLTYRAQKPRSFAYCSDTKYFEPIADLVKGVDLLFHEATFDHSLEEMASKTGHSTATQAARIAKLAQVGKLIIGHFSSRYKDLDILLNQAKAVFPNTTLAQDGDRYSVMPHRINEVEP